MYCYQGKRCCLLQRLFLTIIGLFLQISFIIIVIEQIDVLVFLKRVFFVLSHLRFYCTEHFKKT